MNTSMYQNQFDTTGECAKMGNAAEISFLKTFSSYGQVQPASKWEQRQHIDFFFTPTSTGKQIAIEVKARKKINRQDTKVDDEKIWIELVNCVGDVGWLLGSCEVIAFEQEKSFLLVNRLKLLDLVKEKCHPFEIVNSASDALYKGYKRKGRKDHLTMIQTCDIRKIADQEVFKI